MENTASDHSKGGDKLTKIKNDSELHCRKVGSDGEALQKWYMKRNEASGKWGLSTVFYFNPNNGRFVNPNA